MCAEPGTLYSRRSVWRWRRDVRYVEPATTPRLQLKANLRHLASRAIAHGVNRVVGIWTPRGQVKSNPLRTETCPICSWPLRAHLKVASAILLRVGVAFVLLLTSWGSCISGGIVDR